MENLLGRFFSFANIFYSMFDVRYKVKDNRKSPQISPSVIFLSSSSACSGCYHHDGRGQPGLPARARYGLSGP